MESEFNLNKKRFKVADNASGLSGSDTVFVYAQTEDLITGEYHGGDIQYGNIVGKFTAPNRIELLFQCKTNDNQLMSGRSEGLISISQDGKLNITFDWHWLSGEQGAGVSNHQEV